MNLIALPQEPVAPPRRLLTPKLIMTLAMLAISAAVFCTMVGCALVRQADEQQALERRNALLGTVQDIRASGADVSSLDPTLIRGLERMTGLKDLRFEADPAAGSGREIQSVLDAQGRIVGWFSWQADHSMAAALGHLLPLLTMTGVLLLGFLGLALWQVRRAVGDLGRSEMLAWSLAHEDSLTGLPNHRKMIELIEAALAARPSDGTVTLAFLDVDGLNDINDALGHGTGDLFLAAWAKRLREVLPGDAKAGRVGGDEFAVMMPAADRATAQRALGAVALALARPFWINEQVVQAGVTIGIAHAPDHAANRDELARRADLALRDAKRKCRGGIKTFDPALDIEFNNRRFIERELRRALAENLLDVHYQPIVSSDGNRIVGAEALARWHHPSRGTIPPASFIVVAEQAGLMNRLGEFVLRRALTDADRWPDLSIAVNLSPVQVRDPALVDLVADVLRQTGIAPSRVVLEMTEGVLIGDPEEARTRLEALRALGVRLALDDFGTGYSSLAYLQEFRFDKLKIDKAFVAPLGRTPRSHTMLQAIVQLGRALGMTLLAEGVETEEQRVFLRLAGCDELQGYLFATPGPREALDLLVAEHALPAPVAASGAR
jgi:diguanylate cyclase (GGDEF)-like protein